MMFLDFLISDQEVEVQSPECFPPSTSQPQYFMQPMFMPYIKGPKMDWTVNGSLYHCCVMQISYIGNYSVFSVSTAMIAYTKEQCSTPTYFPYFLASLL